MRTQIDAPKHLREQGDRQRRMRLAGEFARRAREPTCIGYHPLTADAPQFRFGYYHAGFGIVPHRSKSQPVSDVDRRRETLVGDDLKVSMRDDHSKPRHPLKSGGLAVDEGLKRRPVSRTVAHFLRSFVGDGRQRIIHARK